jgi:hypothetical protein
LAELETMLVLAESFRYGDAAAVAALLKNTDEEGKMLRGLQKTLKSRAVI